MSSPAYLQREDYNIFTVDWQPLTRFPCYISAISNTRLVAQCTAQLYAYIMDLGGNAKKTTCVGHSLGAHICGMMSNHLTRKQYKIVGKVVWIFVSCSYSFTKQLPPIPIWESNITLWKLPFEEYNNVNVTRVQGL